MNWNVEVYDPSNKFMTAGLSDLPMYTPAWYMSQVGRHGYRFIRALIVHNGQTIATADTPIDEPAESYARRMGWTDAPAGGPAPIPPPIPVRVGKVGSPARLAKDIFELTEALETGFAPFRDDGSLMMTQEPFGPGEGWLADGHPLNVILGQGWIVGQLEALQPLIDAGTVPAPYLMLDDPELVVDSEIDWLPIAAAAGVVGGLLLFAGLKRRTHAR